MKIPSEIRICGVNYKVVYVEFLNNGTNICNGHIDFYRCEIQLNAGDEYDHQKLCLILWHEIMHGIQNYIGVDLGDKEEEIVDMFARGVYQVLQDNGRQLFDIADGKESAK